MPKAAKTAAINGTKNDDEFSPRLMAAALEDEDFVVVLEVDVDFVVWDAVLSAVPSA